jgi:hypothetical protein
MGGVDVYSHIHVVSTIIVSAVSLAKRVVWEKCSLFRHLALVKRMIVQVIKLVLQPEFPFIWHKLLQRARTKRGLYVLYIYEL